MRLAISEKNIEIAWRISGIAVVSSIAIPETVSLSSLRFQVSHNTTSKSHAISRRIEWINRQKCYRVFFL